MIQNFWVVIILNNTRRSAATYAGENRKERVLESRNDELILIA